MNTIDKKLKNVKEFINEDASLDPSALESFANSKKVYIQGSTPDIQVPFREITISDTPSEFGAEKNVPVLVYDLLMRLQSGLAREAGGPCGPELQASWGNLLGWVPLSCILRDRVRILLGEPS